jgi:hypothetical protein
MKRTRREVGLLMAIPGLLLLFIYLYACHGKLQRQIVEQQNRLAMTRASAPSPVRLASERANVGKLKDDLQDSERRRDHCQTRLDDLAAQLGSLHDQNEAIGALTALFAKLELHIEEAGAETPSQADSVLPGSLRAVADVLKPNSRFRPPQLYRVKFVGRYLDVTRALRTTVDEGLAIPVQLQMEATNLDTDWRVWTLHLWI